MICRDLSSLTLCGVISTLTNKLVNLVCFILERGKHTGALSRDEQAACANAWQQWERCGRPERAVFYSPPVGMGVFAACTNGNVTLNRPLQPAIGVPEFTVPRRIDAQPARPAIPTQAVRALDRDGQTVRVARAAQPARIGPPAN
jgi:hypothetical protein